MRTECACNEGVATLIVSPYSKDKSGGVCGWANKHAKTSHGVSQDEGGGGGPALCNRLTPCFCWHGCLRVPGSTQTEEPGCPTTTHIWVRRCRLGRTVGRYAFSSHRARAHAFSRPAARAHASCMWILDVSWVRSCMFKSRARMHHACGLFNSRARACVMHANSACEF